MNDQILKDKVAIITGGTSGIGRACVKLFCEKGSNVVIAARNEVKASNIINEVEEKGCGKAIFIQTDITVPDQVRHLVSRTKEEFGRVDILFGNAGIFPVGTAPNTTIDTWRECIDVNLSSNFYLAKYGVPALIESGGGVIIFTSGELGLFGKREGVAYCASKAGLINMTRAIAVDSAPHGIRVNCLAPGPIMTPMLCDWFENAENPEEMEMAQRKPVLLDRWGTPEEIAEVALFLASDSSSYITGSLIVSDGGVSAWYGL
jgi:NAD(P)-dependent dehydrogenase (short-subunit alcohol dehydrogenase family)